MTNFWSYLGARKKFIWGKSCSHLGGTVRDIIVVSHCIWPQMYCDHAGPFVGHIYQGSSCVLLNVANFPLCHSVLKMYVYTTVSNYLPFLGTMVNEAIISKMAIISMIVGNPYSPLQCKSLKSLLGTDSLITSDASLQVHIGQF